MRKITTRVVCAVLACIAYCGVQAQQNTVEAVLKNADGAELGIVLFTETSEGVVVAVTAKDLPAGKHGFHVHTEGSCEASTDEAGTEVMHGAAGGHFDPYETGIHAGPDAASEEGHAGDLPNLEVAEDGTVSMTFVTTKMTVADGPASLLGRTIMVHANEDNYSNEPQNGGSGERIACGVITLQ